MFNCRNQKKNTFDWKGTLKSKFSAHCNFPSVVFESQSLLLTVSLLKCVIKMSRCQASYSKLLSHHNPDLSTGCPFLLPLISFFNFTLKRQTSASWCLKWLTISLTCCLVSAQWVESLPPACPRTWLEHCPQTSASTSTPSSRWTILKSTRWRSTACTCSMTRTWSLPTPPRRTRSASTGSNCRSCAGVRMLPGRSLHLGGGFVDLFSVDFPHRPTTIKTHKRAFKRTDQKWVKTAAGLASLQEVVCDWRQWSYGMNNVHGSVTTISFFQNDTSSYDLFYIVFILRELDHTGRRSLVSLFSINDWRNYLQYTYHSRVNIE